MVIGIHAVAAFKKQRTGVEEYTYQLIRHLAMLEESGRHQFFLYTPSIKNQEGLENLPDNFEIKILKWPFKKLWTQGRLSLEMLRHTQKYTDFMRVFRSRYTPSSINPSDLTTGQAPKEKVDVLFIPAHVPSLICPKNCVVTIHGLEYEYLPEAYSNFQRRYLRCFTRAAVKKAQKVIAASENTKDDLVKLYGVDPKKIEVIWHGVNENSQPAAGQLRQESRVIGPKAEKLKQPYILYLGRVERKKNIDGIVGAFEILKERYEIPYKLILAGGRGYGHEKSKFKSQKSKVGSDVMFTGYVSEEEKWGLLREAEVFVFPSFYEGFGMPVLEAQLVGTPVVASDNSSFPEILKESALLVDPYDTQKIAETIYKLIKDKDLRSEIIKKGYDNVKRFSWEECAKQTLRVLASL